MSPIKPPQFHLVVDTNCLYTEAADKLLSLEISDFILKGSKLLGLEIAWYLPPVVKAERNYQMLEKAKGLLPNIQKLEKLLGHALNINEQILADRVRDAIAHQIKLHDIKELAVDTSRVNWDNLIECAMFRRPPFQPGEKEKGFRDALVLEAFVQLTEELPKSNSSARIVLLTNDAVLQDAARERFENRTNVSIAKDLDELRTALNAVASEITQDVIQGVVPQAGRLFFEADIKETLYYKADLPKKISSEFSAVIRKGPKEGGTASVEKIKIGTPTFLKKTNQRLSFSTKINVEVEAINFVPRSTPSTQPGLTTNIGTASTIDPTATSSALLGLGGLGTTISTQSPNLSPGLVNFLGGDYSTIKKYGVHIFEVSWSATLTKRGKLINPKLEKIQYHSSTWED
jgi:hypothetical protein